MGLPKTSWCLAWFVGMVVIRKAERCLCHARCIRTAEIDQGHGTLHLRWKTVSTLRHKEILLHEWSGARLLFDLARDNVKGKIWLGFKMGANLKVVWHNEWTSSHTGKPKLTYQVSMLGTRHIAHSEIFVEREPILGTGEIGPHVISRRSRRLACSWYQSDGHEATVKCDNQNCSDTVCKEL